MVLARAARDRTFIAISHSSELWSNVIAADTVCKLPQCECVTISHAACAVERPVRLEHDRTDVRGTGCGMTKVVTALLAKGARLDIESGIDGKTALQMAEAAKCTTNAALIRGADR